MNTDYSSDLSSSSISSAHLLSIEAAVNALITLGNIATTGLNSEKAERLEHYKKRMVEDKELIDSLLKLASTSASTSSTNPYIRIRRYSRRFEFMYSFTHKHKEH